jgi:hypothetical protein
MAGTTGLEILPKEIFLLTFDQLVAGSRFMLKWLLAAVGLYGGFVALVYVAQFGGDTDGEPGDQFRFHGVGRWNPLDEASFAPYPVHRLAAVDFTKQIPRSEQRSMDAWQRTGTYAAGLALERGHRGLRAGAVAH